MATRVQQIESRTLIVTGIKRWAVQMIASLFIFGALLFLLAGKLTWTAPAVPRDVVGRRVAFKKCS